MERGGLKRQSKPKAKKNELRQHLLHNANRTIQKHGVCSTSVARFGGFQAHLFQDIINICTQWGKKCTEEKWIAAHRNSFSSYLKQIWDLCIYGKYFFVGLWILISPWGTKNGPKLKQNWIYAEHCSSSGKNTFGEHIKNIHIEHQNFYRWDVQSGSFVSHGICVRLSRESPHQIAGINGQKWSWAIWQVHHLQFGKVIWEWDSMFRNICIDRFGTPYPIPEYWMLNVCKLWWEIKKEKQRSQILNEE